MTKLKKNILRYLRNDTQKKTSIFNHRNILEIQKVILLAFFGELPDDSFGQSGGPAGT